MAHELTVKELSRMRGAALGDAAANRGWNESSVAAVEHVLQHFSLA
jgi:hypothetical protein